jgi:hypothetical protein
VSLLLGVEEQSAAAAATSYRPIDRAGLPLVVIAPSAIEREAHAALLAKIAKKAGGTALWMTVIGDDARPSAPAAAQPAAAPPARRAAEFEPALPGPGPVPALA